MIQERLRLLRERMKESGVTVYVIPSSDCHESEYVCGHYRARAYITGFTGSAGTAVVTLQDAGLWTDGRYFIQAQMQLQDTGIRLFRTGGELQRGITKKQRCDFRPRFLVFVETSFDRCVPHPCLWLCPAY